jgi:hypothetical protein
MRKLSGHAPLSILVTLFLFLTGCKEDPVPPTVIAVDIYNISSNSASISGQIINNGGASITEKGICWSVQTMPDSSDFKTENGSGNSDFVGELTGLDHFSTYYVRAYAVNAAGISYGEELSFKTSPMVPAVTTGVNTNLKSTSVTVDGVVTSDGGAAVTAKGICWGTQPNPTIEGDSSDEGAGNGSFTSQISGLTPDSDYYARAYATNSAGTAYGSQITFRTPKFSIGQTYGGGIIFYIDQTGEHGLIAAHADQSNNADWGCAGVSVSTSLEVGFGNQNTVNIVAACGTSGIAARLCSDLDIDGINDWYLPSINELGFMYLNLHVAGLGNFNTDKNYWSSTQSDANMAFVFSFAWNYSGAVIKSGYPEFSRLNVRAIRAF